MRVERKIIVTGITCRGSSGLGEGGLQGVRGEPLLGKTPLEERNTSGHVRQSVDPSRYISE